MENKPTICADCKWHIIHVYVWPWDKTRHECTAVGTLNFVTGKREVDIGFCSERNKGNCKRFEPKEE
jgi:hypothetical protein